MSNLRELAYRVDPVLWVREILGVTPTALARNISALAARSIHSCVDGAPKWQNNHGCMGDCALQVVLARFVVGDWLSRATPKCGSGATGKSDPH